MTNWKERAAKARERLKSLRKQADRVKQRYVHATAGTRMAENLLPLDILELATYLFLNGQRDMAQGALEMHCYRYATQLSEHHATERAFDAWMTREEARLA